MINDYELIYLVQNEQDEIALLRLINKYKSLIYKNIYYSNAKTYEYDDLYQEALVLLVYVVKNFNENKNKTFTKYYDLVLKRQINRLSYKSNRYVLNEELEGIVSKTYQVYNYQEEEKKFNKYFSNLNEIEQIVYKLIYQKLLKPAQVAQVLQLDVKKIYNVLYRIKVKSKSFDIDL